MKHFLCDFYVFYVCYTETQTIVLLPRIGCFCNFFGNFLEAVVLPKKTKNIKAGYWK